MLLLTSALVLLAGCSRTVDDVRKWETDGNQEKLEDALTDPKVEVRKAAAQSLGQLKATDAVDVLAACMNDEEESVRIAAVQALIAIGSPSTVTPLIAALKLDNADIRIEAATALGKMKAEAALEALAEALDDPDEELQLAACRAIGQIASESGSQPLANKLANASTSAKVRMACIDALAGTGGSVALKALVDTLADSDERIRESATTAIIKIGDAAVPSIMEGLRSENSTVRSSSIALLRGLNAIPTRDSGLVWYQLARASVSDEERVKSTVIETLAAEGEAAIPTLLTAVAYNVESIRETAALTLEWIGGAAVEQSVNRATRVAKPAAKQWFDSRTTWAGAPSPLLDLWGAVSALNPDLEIEADTMTALQAGGSQANRILNRSSFAASRAYIPSLINLFGDADCAAAAKKKVDAAGAMAALPLIAAISSDRIAIAEAAADILSDRMDVRAFQPLMDAIQRRLDNGESLSLSPLYNALQKQDNIEAEPLLLQIRPNTERAIQVFGRQFRDVKIVGAETSDLYTDNDAPVTFRVGYTMDGAPGALEVTFKKDDNGNWRPSPALPYRLPDSN
jgi:HEAT repeat protein